MKKDVPDTNAGDLISRQEAIKAILGEPPEVNYPIYYAEKIRELPSVQPQTSTISIGRTNGGTTMWYECDACGEPIDIKDNFCRNCGRWLMKDE